MKTASLWRNAVVLVVMVSLLVLVAPPKVAQAAPAASGCHPVYYTIRCGDTLSRIAARFGVSVWALARENGIRNPNRIFAGKTLVIHACGCTSCCYGCNPPIPHRVHIVRCGETLSMIAFRYGVSVWHIAQANGIHNINLIYAGQRLLIP